MIWTSASEFFHMGGYGFYVWGSYAVTLLVMVTEPLLARRRHSQAIQHVARSLDSNEVDA